MREIRACWEELLAFLSEDKACSGLVLLNPAPALSMVLNQLEGLPSLFISLSPSLCLYLSCPLIVFSISPSQLHRRFIVMKHSLLPQQCQRIQRWNDSSQTSPQGSNKYIMHSIRFSTSENSQLFIHSNYFRVVGYGSSIDHDHNFPKPQSSSFCTFTCQLQQCQIRNGWHGLLWKAMTKDLLYCLVWKT